MAKKYFELRMDYEALKEAYHNDSPNMTQAEAEKAADAIIAAREAVSASITDGANDTASGSRPVGMERRPGMFEIFDMDNPMIASMGSTPDEAVYHWNNGNYNALRSAPEAEVVLTDSDAKPSKKKSEGTIENA